MKRYLTLLALLASMPSAAQDTDLIPRAVVQFDGTRWDGTFTQSANTITVVQDSDSNTGDVYTPKNVRVGDLVWLDFASTFPTDGSFEVTNVTGTTFTVSSPAGSASGDVAIRVHVRYRANIASVAWTKGALNWCSAGCYVIRFATPFQSDAYAAVGGQRFWKTEHTTDENTVDQTPSTFTAQFWKTDGNRADAEYVSFAFYGRLQGEP